MNIDPQLLYTKTHEWIRVEGDKAYIGLTDFAQEHLGDIVFVELPEADKAVTVGGELCVVESVKTVATVYSPLTGSVILVNDALEDAPESLNENPYGAWISAVRIENADELGALLTPQQYETVCQEEEV
jgi:glycine cleavage system H protein